MSDSIILEQGEFFEARRKKLIMYRYWFSGQYSVDTDADAATSVISADGTILADNEHDGAGRVLFLLWAEPWDGEAKKLASDVCEQPGVHGGLATELLRVLAVGLGRDAADEFRATGYDACVFFHQLPCAWSDAGQSILPAADPVGHGLAASHVLHSPADLLSEAADCVVFHDGGDPGAADADTELRGAVAGSVAVGCWVCDHVLFPPPGAADPDCCPAEAATPGSVAMDGGSGCVAATSLLVLWYVCVVNGRMGDTGW